MFGTVQAGLFTVQVWALTVVPTGQNAVLNMFSRETFFESMSYRRDHGYR